MKLSPELEALDRLVEESYGSVYTSNLPAWASNMRFWTRHLYGKRPFNIDQLTLPGYDGKNVFLVGSGPSLTGLLPEEVAGTTLMAGATCVPYLLSQKIWPDIIVISDSHPILHAYLWDVREELRDTPIVLPVTADPRWAEHPVGSGYFFYKPYFQVRGEDNMQNAFNTIVERLFPEVPPWTVQAGSVMNTMLATLMHVVLHGVTWPISRAILLGADYGHHKGGAKRIPMAAGIRGYAGRTTFMPDPPSAMEDIEVGKNVTTLANILYGLGTLLIAKACPFDVILASPFSMLSSFLPNSPLHLSAVQPVPYTDKESKNAFYEDASTRYGALVNPIIEDARKKAADARLEMLQLQAKILQGSSEPVRNAPDEGHA